MFHLDLMTYKIDKLVIDIGVVREEIKVLNFIFESLTKKLVSL